MSVVSLRMPPWLRNSSSPARSVSTLKLIARSAFTTAKRAIFASSHPAMTTTIANARFGRNAPNRSQAPRSGSSRASNSIVCYLLLCRRHQPDDTGQRCAHPVRPVIELVAQLVQRFFQLEEREQRAHVGFARVNPGAARGLV